VRLSSGDNLRELWEEHQAAGVPAELYRCPGGVEMVLGDSIIAGCASSIVATGRLSDPSHAAVRPPLNDSIVRRRREAAG
jgi:hypothetical protein